jgi:hypothetical protein
MNYVQKDHMTLSVTFSLINNTEINVFVRYFKFTALLLLVLQYLNFRSKSSIRYYKNKCNCLLKIQTFSSNTGIF